MPRINAGQDFGRLTPQAGGFADVAQVQAPRALAEVGQRMEAEGLQAERVAQAEERQQMREAMQAREAADRARASSVLSLTRDRVADALGSIEQEVADGRLPKTEAAKAWKERTAGLIESSLADAPEAHRSLIQQDLQGLVMRFDSKVGDIVRRRDQADTRADLSTTLESLQRRATTDYEGSRLSALAALDQLGPAAGMAPDQVAKAKQSWVEGAAYTRAFTALNAGKNDNGTLSKVEAFIQQNQDLDPQKRAQLLGQVDTYRAANEARAIRRAQAAEIAAARADRESAKAFDVLQGWALAGKMADPEAAAGLVAKLDPTRLAAYKAMAADIPARTAAAMLPLDQQQAQLDALIAQRATKGTSEALEKEIDRREKVLNESRREYAADPLRAAASRGVIDKIAPLDTTSLDGMVSSLAGRVEQAQTVATRAGRSVSPLLPEEAGRLGDLLGALAPSARGRAIAQMGSTLPRGMMGAIAAQIDGKDRALALQMAAGGAMTTEGRTVAELIGRGAQALKDKAVKEDQGAEIGLRSQLVKELGDALSGKARDDVIDAARLIYLGKQAEGSGLSVAGAVRLAVGGPLVDFNGRRVPLPAGMDEGALQRRLETYPRAEIDKQSADGFVYLPGNRPMGVPEFLANLPKSQLEPVAPGRYAVRAQGSLVLGKDRKPIVVGVQ